jgi:hypothetical protein
VTSEGLAHLAGLENLTTLQLKDTEIDDAGLEHVGKLLGLEVLDLSGTGVSAAGIAHLSALTSIEGIDLGHTLVDDEAMAHLGTHTSLIELNLAATAVTDEGLSALSGLTGLEALSVAKTAVSDEGLGHLKEAKGIQDLNISNTAITGSSLAAFPALERLFVSCPALDAAGLAAISHLESLSFMFVSGDYDSLLELLDHAHLLERLDTRIVVSVRKMGLHAAEEGDREEAEYALIEKLREAEQEIMEKIPFVNMLQVKPEKTPEND